ncbi:hypothetical protein GCM10020370_56100 [Paenibacillus hodogayensis]
MPCKTRNTKNKPMEWENAAPKDAAQYKTSAGKSTFLLPLLSASGPNTICMTAKATKNKETVKLIK